MGKNRIVKAHTRKGKRGVVTYLNQVRVDKGLTLNEIAKQLGYPSTGNLGNWFAGVNKVPVAKAPALAKILGIDVCEIPTTDGRKAGARKGESHAPCAYTDTFWSKKRIEKNMTIAQLAKDIGVHRVSVGKYLTGMYLPSDEIIKQFCDLFDVDFMRGKGEFFKAHQTYKVQHGKKSAVHRVEKKVDVVVDKSEVEAEPVAEPKKFSMSNWVTKDIEVEPVAPVANQALELIYGKLSYQDFMQVFNVIHDGDYSEPMKMLYGKVDFKLFTSVERLLASAT